MATNGLNKVFLHLRRAVLLQDGAGQTDGKLLGMFIEQADEAAFEVLMRRHGPMVLGLCRRILRNQQDALDAFQATFLVLVRKANSVKPRELVGNWLHAVARQTAIRMRSKNAKRWWREKQVTIMPEPQALSSESNDDLLILDQELSRLPAKYRIAIVLCDLEGKTRKQAARQLGWPEGTLGTRLARGRTMLAKRIAKHGLVFSVEALAAVLSQNMASGCLPPTLVSATVKAASLMAAGQTVATGLISAKVAALTQGAVKGMLLTKLKTLVAVLVLAGISTFGGGLFVQRTAGTLAADEVREGTTASKDAKAANELAGQEPKVKEPKLRATLKGHKATVRSVAINPDGKSLASGSFDGTIKVWDMETGHELAILQGHKVICVAYSPDGKFLASGSVDKTIKLWNVATGMEVANLKGHEDSVFSLAYSPDGKVLASASRDNTIKLWDVATRLEKATLKGHTVPVASVAYSPDGKILASGSGSIKLWDVAAGREIATIDGYQNELLFVAFSPDGQTLASGGGSIKLWEVVTGKKLATFRGLTSYAWCVAYSPDGKTLAGAIEDKTIILWDVATGTVQATLKDHAGPVYAVAYSPDGKTLASAGADGTIILWDIPTAQEIKKENKSATQDQQKKQPKEFTNSIGMKFVWIPPGSFLMGSPKKEPERGGGRGRGDDETQHRVTLTKGFYMGVYTVTQEQWQAVMANNPSQFNGEKNLPVEKVYWDDCQEFIKKLGEKDKKEYRLPTEAEWEYSCRAGTTTPFHFGETISTDQANYNGDVPPYAFSPSISPSMGKYNPMEKFKKGVYRKKTTPVGSFPANAFGLYDMHGNVWQWCQDWYGDYPENAVVDPTGPESGYSRVLRGGSFSGPASFVRSASRRADDRPTYRDPNVGFRLARTFTADEAKQSTPPTKDTNQPQVPGAENVSTNNMKADRILIWKEGGLASIRPNGEDFKWVTERGWEKGVTFYPVPRLSPNGQFVAYRINGKDKVGKESFKYLVKGLDESGQGREIDVADKGGIYGWSPDGNKIFFSMAESITPQRFSHWLLDLRTMEKTALKIPEDHVIWDWSPDGKWFLTTWIAAKKNGESSGQRLHLVKIDGSEITEIGDPNQDVFRGLFSPDGKKILFKTRGQLHVLNLATGKARPVPLPVDHDFVLFCWSADGKRIAYSTQERREHDIVTIDEEGIDPKTIMTEQELFLLDWR